MSESNQGIKPSESLMNLFNEIQAEKEKGWNPL